MRRAIVLAMTATSLVPAALAAGCGSSSDDSASPNAQVTGAFPLRGISFEPPAGWTLSGGNGPLVATAQAGQATVAVWRYPRTERLPKTQDELKAARDALVAASQRRDRSFEVIKSAPTTVAGKPAVQIRATETIAGVPRTVRSTHIYSGRAEIVVDAYADADSFRQTDAKVFRPLLRSLQVHKPGSA